MIMNICHITITVIFLLLLGILNNGIDGMNDLGLLRLLLMILLVRDLVIIFLVRVLEGVLRLSKDVFNLDIICDILLRR